MSPRRNQQPPGGFSSPSCTAHTPGFLHHPPRLAGGPSLHLSAKTTTFPSNFCHVTGGSTKAVSSDASRLSLQQSRALPFGKKEHFPRKTQTRALLALVASVLFIRLLQKHLDGWSSAPCALTESGSHEPTLGRTKGRSVWVGAAHQDAAPPPAGPAVSKTSPSFCCWPPGEPPAQFLSLRWHPCPSAQMLGCCRDRADLFLPWC